MNSKWTPNEKQVAFMTVLKEHGSCTLREASKEIGKEIKSGTVNTLVTKGYVATEDKTFECNIVAQETNEIVGHCKKTIKVYSLVDKE